MGKLVKDSSTGRRGPGRRAHRRIVMEGPMTIYQATEQKRALLDALTRGAELEIDLSGVTEMDTAGIQLLLLAKREASGSNKRVRLTAHSQASLDAIDLFNLGAYFGDPVVISPRKS